MSGVTGRTRKDRANLGEDLGARLDPESSANLFLSEFIRALQSPSYCFRLLAGFCAYCLHFLLALFLGIPGHILESSSFLCQSLENL